TRMLQHRRVFDLLPCLPIFHLARFKGHSAVRAGKGGVFVRRARRMRNGIGPPLADDCWLVGCLWASVGICLVNVGDGSRGKALLRHGGLWAFTRTEVG